MTPPKEQDVAALVAIETDPFDPTREYIPLPGGWEVQTKGAGSTYRLLDKKTGERYPILNDGDWRPLQAFFTRFAHEVYAASIVAATALSTLAEKLDWSFHALADETKRHLECEAASEARATALEGERDEWRAKCLFEIGRRATAEAQLARAREALEAAWPAVASKEAGLAPWADKFEGRVNKWTAVLNLMDEALRSITAPADGRGEFVNFGPSEHGQALKAKRNAERAQTGEREDGDA